jgi:hypothetical protein
LDPSQLLEKTVTVVSRPQLEAKLGIQPEQTTTNTFVPQDTEPPTFSTVEEKKIAQITYPQSGEPAQETAKRESFAKEGAPSGASKGSLKSVPSDANGAGRCGCQA